MKKDIVHRKNGKIHGYVERYDFNDNLWARGNWKNGSQIGYEEWYYGKETRFIIR